MMSIEQTLILIQRINDSFYNLSGENLYSPQTPPELYQWLHEAAPYSILAHNAEADPHFIYANKYALSCFKYSEEEIRSLPSRLSAVEQERPERERLLRTIMQDGIAYNYSGPRVDKYGAGFTIYDGVVWQLQHGNGEIWGQAAFFWTKEHERPEWFTGRNVIPF